MAPITLQRDTRTLRWPEFADLATAYKAAQSGSVIDMNFFKVSGRVNGLNTTVMPGARSTWDKTFVLDKEGVRIMNGTIDLPDNVGLLITASTTFENVTITGKGLKWHRRLDPYVVRVTGGAHVSFEESIVEGESDEEGHALLVDNRAVCVVSGTRVYGGGNRGGNAIKVSGGAALIRKRSLIQGGVLVTAPQHAPTPPAPATSTRVGSTTSVQAPGTPPHSQHPTASDKAAPGDNSSTPPKDPAVLPAGEEAAAEQQAAAETIEAAAAEQEATSQAVPEAPDGAAEQAGAGAEAGDEEAVQGGTMEQLDAELEANSSSVEMKNSEIRQGSAAVYATGSGTRVTIDSCTLTGHNFSLLAAHGAHVEVRGSTLIDAATAAATISSGAHLEADTTVFAGGLLGLTVERTGTAQLTRCTLVSRHGGSANEPLPPPPKPGFLPDPRITPAVAEVRGAGSVLQAFDCTYGRDNAALPREVAGGMFLREDGVAAATA